MISGYLSIFLAESGDNRRRGNNITSTIQQAVGAGISDQRTWSVEALIAQVYGDLSLRDRFNCFLPLFDIQNPNRVL